MKYKDIVLMNASLQKLVNATNLPLKVMYGAGQVFKQLQEIQEVFNKKQKVLWEKYSVHKLIPNPEKPEEKIKSREQEIPVEDVKAFNMESETIGEEDIADLYHFEIKLSDLKSNYVFLKELNEKFSEKVDVFLEELHKFEKTPTDDILRGKLEIARKDLTKIISSIRDKTESLKNDSDFNVLDIGNLMSWIVDDSK